tara:strand:+ start:942 stop:1193 length:252 start_codon:yes stop_codon:yes gene_type:complete
VKEREFEIHGDEGYIYAYMRGKSLYIVTCTSTGAGYAAQINHDQLKKLHLELGRRLEWLESNGPVLNEIAELEARLAELKAQL